MISYKKSSAKKYYLVILNMIIWAKIYMEPPIYIYKKFTCRFKKWQKTAKCGPFLPKNKTGF